MNINNLCLGRWVISETLENLSRAIDRKFEWRLLPSAPPLLSHVRPLAQWGKKRAMTSPTPWRTGPWMAGLGDDVTRGGWYVALTQQRVGQATHTTWKTPRSPTDFLFRFFTYFSAFRFDITRYVTCLNRCHHVWSSFPYLYDPGITQGRVYGVWGKTAQLG